jgi:glycosyltransferase involved in cell wall biosynthesis
MKPLVSVIVPSYNHAHYISHTLSSVINQTYKDLEIIVIDDGSSDNSYQIISQQTDCRIKLVRQENQGAHAAINLGISMAEGEYISILNSDDLYAPKRIEILIDAAKKSIEPALFTSYIDVIDSNGVTLGTKKAFNNMLPYVIESPEKTFLSTSDPLKNILMFNYVSTTSNFFFHRDIYESVGNFLNLRYVHDWDYLLRVVQNYPISIVEEPLLKYRIHASNTIRENQSRMILEICWILAKHYPNILAKMINEACDEVEIYKLLIQIYNSIQVFGCEKILLNLVLLFSAASSIDNYMNLPDSEMEFLLDPTNSMHQALAQEISNILNSLQSVSSKDHQVENKTILEGKKWKRKLKHLFLRFKPLA